MSASTHQMLKLSVLLQICLADAMHRDTGWKSVTSGDVKCMYLRIPLYKKLVWNFHVWHLAFVGQSNVDSNDVLFLVIYLTTRSITSQYHVVFGDNFSTFDSVQLKVTMFVTIDYTLEDAQVHLWDAGSQILSSNWNNEICNVKNRLVRFNILLLQIHQTQQGNSSHQLQQTLEVFLLLV